MIIQGNTTTIERSGGINENKFTIEANGKAFRVLSDSLYPDKPKAIIRELSCNAYDAHVAAGKEDQPFTIHLPTALEPWLTIRDYGIGLTPEQVAGYWKDVTLSDGTIEKVFVGGVYNTFFKSTKTNSNKYIGALGLGSKSPFSYVDSFTVISRKDGMKYSFTAYINEQDEPEIVELGREPTTEGNGLEVSMPVNKQDFHQFAEKAKVVLQWFDPMPIVTGYPNFTPTKMTTSVRADTWTLYTHNPYGFRGAVAIQGKVAYPIDTNALSHLATNSQMAVLQGPFVLHFDIGDLDVTASRETLSYKGPTINNVLAAADRVIEQLPGKFQESFDECTTLWNARLHLTNLLSINRVLYDLMAGTSKHFLWKKIKLDVTANHFVVDTGSMPSVVVTEFNSRSPRKINFALKTSLKEQYRVGASESAVIFLDDLPRGSFTRVKRFHKARSRYDPTYLFTGDAVELEKLVENLGNPTVRKASELPAPARALSSGAPATVFTMCDEKYSLDFDPVDAEDFEFEDGGFYISMLRGYPEVKGRKDEEFASIIRNAKKLGLIAADEIVYGITRSRITKFDESKDWINIYDHIKEKLTEHINTKELGEHLELAGTYDVWWSSLSWDQRWVKSHNSWTKMIAEDHPLNLFKKKIKERNSVDIHEAVQLAKSLNVTIARTSGRAYDFVSEWKAILKRYPMLTICSNTDENKDAIIAQYINHIDSIPK